MFYFYFSTINTSNTLYLVLTYQERYFGLKMTAQEWKILKFELGGIKAIIDFSIGFALELFSINMKREYTGKAYS